MIRGRSRRAAGAAFVPAGLAAFLFVLLCNAVQGADPVWDVIDSPAVSVQFASPARAAASTVLRAFHGALAGVEGVLPWKLVSRPTVLLAHDRGAFRERVGNDLAVAIAVPANSLIILDSARVAAHPGSLEGILRHELCHLILHEHVGEDRLPRWLDEGVCQWVSQGATELLGAGRAPGLEDAAVFGQLIPLARLSKSFPSTTPEIRLAYEQSRSFVDFLSDRYGKDRVLSLLERLRQVYLEEAVQATFGTTQEDLEGAWRKSLTKRYDWLVLISTNVDAILFFFGAVLVVAGFVRVLLNRRRQPLDDDEHQAGGPDDSP